MWGQNTFGVSVIFGLLSITIPISGRSKQTLSTIGCVLNTRDPNPLDRQTYYECTAKGRTLIRCPETMVFEPDSSSCVKNEKASIYVPRCTRSLHGAYIPAYCDCRKFWRCNFQSAFLFTCGEGTYWSQQYLACVHPYQANCQPNIGCKENDVKGSFEMKF